MSPIRPVRSRCSVRSSQHSSSCADQFPAREIDGNAVLGNQGMGGGHADRQDEQPPQNDELVLVP